MFQGINIGFLKKNYYKVAAQKKAEIIWGERGEICPLLDLYFPTHLRRSGFVSLSSLFYLKEHFSAEPLLLTSKK
ncbi:MAG TPA: hypothetical protein ENJ95_17320 [Bacteroidetes bacterium]|nr:hypothetical protein [Bacteroidota bacterium]